MPGLQTPLPSSDFTFHFQGCSSGPTTRLYLYKMRMKRCPNSSWWASQITCTLFLQRSVQTSFAECPANMYSESMPAQHIRETPVDMCSACEAVEFLAISSLYRTSITRLCFPLCAGQGQCCVRHSRVCRFHVTCKTFLGCPLTILLRSSRTILCRSCKR